MAYLAGPIWLSDEDPVEFLLAAGKPVVMRAYSSVG